jgi:outer membrane protein assembly factor BamB
MSIRGSRFGCFDGSAASLRWMALGVLLVGCGWLISLEVRAADWPRYRGPNLDGISTETGWSVDWPATGPKQLWKTNVGIGFSSISVADGRAYTMGNRDDQDTVYCFDAASGQTLWKHSYPCKLDPKYYDGGPSATPTIDAGRVYTLSKEGEIFCLEAANGKVVWSVNLARELDAKVPTWGFSSSPVIQGNVVYVNVGALGSALDKTTGKVIWTTGKEAAGYSSFVPFTMGATRGLALLTAQTVAAVDPDSGKQLWAYPWKTSYDVNAADPIIAGDHVLISSGYNHGAALLKIVDGKPERVWENKRMRNQHNNCVLIDGALYGIDGDDSKAELKCLDFKTGEVKWTEKGLGKGALMAADGKLIILAEKGELVVAAVDPAAFKPLARWQVLGGKCWTMPVLSHGRIYCRNAAGDLVCVDVSGN